MTTEEIYDQLTPIFHDIFDDDDIVLEASTTASDIEDWDSLTQIRIVVAAEKKFALKFKSTDISALKNVGNFVNLIQSQL